LGHNQMKSLKKVIRALLGLGLYARYTEQFDTSILKEKRVALVGPANSAYGTNQGAFIDGFDYVIRINKAPALIHSGKFKHDIGTKTDILFHSFVENDFSGGGPLDFDLFDKLGIRYVINPLPSFLGKRVTFNFFKKYLLGRTIYGLSGAKYFQAVKVFGRFRPTTGFCALKMVLEAAPSELFITGFTFFKTPYGDNYRDALKDVEKNRAYIDKEKIHNPDIEFEEFLRMYKANTQTSIRFDDTLYSIVSQHLSKGNVSA